MKKDLSRNQIIKLYHHQTGKPYSICRAELKASGWDMLKAYEIELKVPTFSLEATIVEKVEVVCKSIAEATEMLCDFLIGTLNRPEVCKCENCRYFRVKVDEDNEETFHCDNDVIGRYVDPDCKEYDRKKNSCPRFNKVIRETLKDAERPTGEWIKKIDDVGFVSYICSSCGFELELEDCSDSYYCSNCGAKMINTNTESEEKNMKEMTVEQYRERLIEAFQNTGCGELIALVCLPNEEAFKALESLLRNFWNKKEEGEEE